MSVTVRRLGVVCSSCGAGHMTAATYIDGDERQDILACPCGEAFSEQRHRETVAVYACGPDACGPVEVGKIWPPNRT